jgi:hypothetical protein
VNRIVAARKLLVDAHELQARELQAALLEPGQNRADQPALDCVWFQNNQ